MNPISEQLRLAAKSAPFVLEKENYLMAAEEIDRLHEAVHGDHHVILPATMIQDVCMFLSTCTLESVRAQELLQQLQNLITPGT